MRMHLNSIELSSKNHELNSGDNIGIEMIKETTSSPIRSCAIKVDIDEIDNVEQYETKRAKVTLVNLIEQSAESVLPLPTPSRFFLGQTGSSSPLLFIPWPERDVEVSVKNVSISDLNIKQSI